MPYQSHLYVGKPINSIADLVSLGGHFGIKQPVQIDDMDWWLEKIDASGASILVEGKAKPLCFFDADEEGSAFAYVYANTITKKLGDSYMLVGVELTSRYSPAIIDEGWTSGGRSEPFVLDLERLASIQAGVRKQWPDAEILLLTTNH